MMRHREKDMATMPVGILLTRRGRPAARVKSSSAHCFMAGAGVVDTDSTRRWNTVVHARRRRWCHGSTRGPRKLFP